MSYTSPTGFLAELQAQRAQAVTSACRGNTTDLASLYTLLIITVQERFSHEEDAWQDTFPEFFQTLRDTVKGTHYSPASIQQVVAFLTFQEERLQAARFEQNPFAQVLIDALKTRMDELIQDDAAMNTWYVLHTMRQKVLDEPGNMSRVYTNLLNYLDEVQGDNRWNDNKFLLGLVEGRKILDGLYNVWRKGRN